MYSMINPWYEFLKTQGADVHKQSVVAFKNQQYPISEITDLNSISDLSHHGLLKVSGPDATPFLQGQLSCDLTKITARTSTLGCYCNPQGRILATFRLFQIKDDYYLFMPRSMISVMQNALEKYSLFSKVTIEPDLQNILIGIAGPSTTSFLKQLNYDFPDEASGVTQTKGLTIIKVRANCSRFICIGSFEAIKLLWCELSSDLIPTTDLAWQYYDIINGIPTIYPETQSQFLPHRINYHLLNGIDFEKGCYVGQEVIARLHYRGKLKHHMFLYEITDANQLQPGLAVAELTQQKIVGHIVDAIEVDPKQWLALIVMQVDHQNIEEAMINDRVNLKKLELPYSLETNQ